MRKSVKPSKRKSKNWVIIAISIIVLSFIVVLAFTFIRTLFKSEENNGTGVEEIQEDKPEVGDVLSGIDIQEIISEYKEQKKSSISDAENYLKSLSGKEIIWIGRSMNIRANWVSGEQYMVISMTEKIIDLNLTYANVENNEEYQKIPDMTMIKISGEIDSVIFDLGVNVYFENATIEVIE